MVATPIGNLGDITFRAVEAIRSADLVACEDTRHSRRLLEHLGIRDKELVALHDHNEKLKSPHWSSGSWTGRGWSICPMRHSGVSDPDTGS